MCQEFCPRGRRLGPNRGGRLGIWLGGSKPRPRGEVGGSGQGGSRPRPRGRLGGLARGGSRPRPRGRLGVWLRGVSRPRPRPMGCPGPGRGYPSIHRGRHLPPTPAEGTLPTAMHSCCFCRCNTTCIQTSDSPSYSAAAFQNKVRNGLLHRQV